jgi:hypothetical protein
MWRRLINRRTPMVGLLAAALAAPIALTSSTGLAATATPPKCVTSHLSVWLGIPGQGAAGSVYYQMQFTNVGSTTCTLYGFPGVSAWNGHMLGSPAPWAHITPTHTVTLAPRATAHTVLRIVNVSNCPVSTCNPVTATALRVFPPNNTVARFIPFPFRACSKAGPQYLDVWGPIVPGVGIP